MFSFVECVKPWFHSNTETRSRGGRGSGLSQNTLRAPWPRTAPLTTPNTSVSNQMQMSSWCAPAKKFEESFSGREGLSPGFLKCLQAGLNSGTQHRAGRAGARLN